MVVAFLTSHQIAWRLQQSTLDTVCVFCSATLPFAEKAWFVYAACAANCTPCVEVMYGLKQASFQKGNGCFCLPTLHVQLFWRKNCCPCTDLGVNRSLQSCGAGLWLPTSSVSSLSGWKTEALVLGVFLWKAFLFQNIRVVKSFVSMPYKSAWWFAAVCTPTTSEKCFLIHLDPL